MKIFVLLPAYNEEESMPTLLPKLKEILDANGQPYEIVVCNDGSRDRTVELATEFAQGMPLTLLQHRINRGLGETMRDLYEYAAEHAADEDYIIRMDCDDTHEPKYVPELIARLREGFDVAIASRFAPGGAQHGVVGYRAFLSRSANLFMKCVFPLRGVKEYSCGYRAYTGAIIRRAIRFYGNNFIQLKGLGFTGTLEKLVKLKIMRARFAEVGFVLRYDQKQSASKMVSSITTLGYLVMAVCYYWPFGGWKWNWGKKFNDFSSADSNQTVPPTSVS